MEQKLKGKVALITGGNSGIGLATAKLFREHGAKLIIVGQNAQTLSAASATLGNDVVAIQINVAKRSELQRLMQDVQTRFGHIDILFANAGISHCPPLEETDDAAFDHVVGINFKAVFFTFTLALPLLAPKASIIFTSSAAHDMGRLGDPLYSATKAAVRSLVRTFAVNETVVAKQMRVNAITPGCVKTPLTEPAHTNAEVTEYLKSVIPMQRWGEPEEIARAVLFLASSDASYMTGAEIAVDGGFAQV